MYRDTLKALDDQSKHYSKSDLRDAFLGEIQGLCHEYIQTICELLRHCKEPGEIARYCTSYVSFRHSPANCLLHYMVSLRIAKFHDTLSVFWRLRKNKGHAKAHSDVAYQAHRIATRSAEPPDLDLLDAIVAFAMFQRYRLNLREESLDILAQAHRGGISCRERLHQAQSLTSGMLDLFDQYFNRLSGMSKKWHTEDSLEGVAVPPGDLT